MAEPLIQCPMFIFTTLWSMLESGLPVHIPEATRQICLPTLETLLGDAFQDHQDKKWIEHPQLKYLDSQHMTDELDWKGAAANSLLSTPIPAYTPDKDAGDAASSQPDPFLGAIRASYQAYEWLKSSSSIDRYPITSATIKMTRETPERDI